MTNIIITFSEKLFAENALDCVTFEFFNGNGNDVGDYELLTLIELISLRFCLLCNIFILYSKLTTIVFH